MKDISTPVPPHEVRAVIKKSLENAALVNYERLSEEARIEGEMMMCKILHLFLLFFSRLGQPSVRRDDWRSGGTSISKAGRLDQISRIVRGSSSSERGVLC